LQLSTRDHAVGAAARVDEQGNLGIGVRQLVKDSQVRLFLGAADHRPDDRFPGGLQVDYPNEADDPLASFDQQE